MESRCKRAGIFYAHLQLRRVHDLTRRVLQRRNRAAETA